MPAPAAFPARAPSQRPSTARDPMTSVVRVEEAPWQAGLHSIRALLGPGLLLQSAALAVVLAYYFVPATAGFFATLARWQTEGGFAFSAASTAVSGGLIPFLFLRLHP